MMWGIIPASGAGGRTQPLAFSRELLPVGSRTDGGQERPRAVSEYLIERMLRVGADRLCFTISPWQSDIISYYGGDIGGARCCYVVQPEPVGLCDALFRPLPLIHPGDSVLIGLPDTIWYPVDGFRLLPADRLSFLLFHVAEPARFDAVLLTDDGAVAEIRVKREPPGSHWIWGAIRAPARVLADLADLWRQRHCADEHLGTLVNAYLAAGGRAAAVRAGREYVDVATLDGYRRAIHLLDSRAPRDEEVVPVPAAPGLRRPRSRSR